MPGRRAFRIQEHSYSIGQRLFVWQKVGYQTRDLARKDGELACIDGSYDWETGSGGTYRSLVMSLLADLAVEKYS